MIFSYSNTFQTRYAHIAGIADSILTQSGNLILDSFKAVNIPVKTGDVVGQESRRLPQKCLDMFATDSDITVKFIQPDHHNESIHAVCPLDYFENSVKTMLLSKNPRTEEPRGGTILYDKAGTLAGDWYTGGLKKYSEGDNEHSLTIAYDNVDPSLIRIGIGGTLIDGWGLFAVAGNGPDPATVTKDSGMVVYKLTDRYDSKVLYTLIMHASNGR